MNKQAEKQMTGQANDKPAKPIKRVLTVETLQHQQGMAVQTGVKAGMKEWRW